MTDTAHEMLRRRAEEAEEREALVIVAHRHAAKKDTQMLPWDVLSPAEKEAWRCAYSKIEADVQMQGHPDPAWAAFVSWVTMLTRIEPGERRNLLSREFLATPETALEGTEYVPPQSPST